MNFQPRVRTPLILIAGIILVSGGILVVQKSKSYLDQKSEEKLTNQLSQFVQDSDKDGLLDVKEEELGTNPYRPDTDKDGILDLEEVQQNTDPKIAETDNLQDPDNDGLTNIDEKRFGTNPYVADTDFDGYLDGEEIASGHDPKKANNKKLLEVLGYKGGRVKGLEDIDLNKLDSLKIESLQATLEEEEDLGKLASVLSGFSDKSPSDFNFSLPEIKEEELNIIQSSNKIIFENYVNNFLSIWYKYFPYKSEEDFRGYTAGLDPQNKGHLSDLISKLEGLYHEWKSLSCPEDLKEIHKKSIAIILEYKDLIQELKDKDFFDFKNIVLLFELMKKAEFLINNFNITIDELNRFTEDQGLEINLPINYL